MLPPGGDGEDLEVVGECIVGGGTYTYGNVNIFGIGKIPGILQFRDATTTFSAKSILVENNGYLLAGWSSMLGKPEPIGRHSGSTLTIRLYGAPGDTPISCKSEPTSTCGVDPQIWNSNADPTKPPQKSDLPGGVTDYFYNYDVMPLTEGKNTRSYFGQKVLAVSYGGTLRIFGKRGALYGSGDADPANSGRSWRRLDGSLKPGDDRLVVDGAVDWHKGDHIVVTTTDYLPAHSEELIITGAIVNHAEKRTRIRFTKATCPDGSAKCGVTCHHWGALYSLSKKDHPGIDRLKLNIESRRGGKKIDAVDTRAAVALLSRSVRIISAGDFPDKDFPTAETGYSFGGHTVVRQGFKAYQMQGIELYQAGQGGRIGHYPVHFHMARRTPPDTFVKDCSIHDSMTRWITLHATQGVLLARNVGYLSIGHGYYIEDGTETDNKLYSNIGIFARAAVQGPPPPGSDSPPDPNPRKVPGILSAAFTDRQYAMPYHSDSDTPSVFWIMNGWNDFQYNFAAGAGSCGVCYWLVPGYNSGTENTFRCYNPQTQQRGAACLNPTPPPPPTTTTTLVPPPPTECEQSNGPGFICAPYSRMAWTGYAAMQSNGARAGTTPLKSFVGNTCTSAMNSFQTVGQFNFCKGVAPFTDYPGGDKEHLAPIKNDLAPPPQNDLAKDLYYPRVIQGASRPATRCGDDPAAVNDKDCGNQDVAAKCDAQAFPPPIPSPLRNCMVTVLDRYTTSFNWADTNFAAIWLRQFWFVLSNSAITDVQNGGITFVTGGDYTRSSVIDGVWSVAAKSAFVGHTQPDPSKDPNANPFAADVGPFNPRSGLQCPINDATLKNLPTPAHCIERGSGVDFEVANFATNQRLFNIYDGPSYEDSNAYLDIVPTKLPDLASQCQPTQNDSCPAALKLYGRLGGMPKDKDGTCYLPNAAIGWKQPNGFFYPPAFHSKNLYFHNASDDPEIRHFVILPEFEQGTLKTDPKRVKARYCTYPIAGDQTPLFESFTDVDRQTVLNDDDGSLTGLLANPKGATRETISVNFDTYFDAPVEALECASDIANPPTGFPPGSAKTSPYEYLTTAVYPACARLNGPPPGETPCGTNVPPAPPPYQNPNWKSDCTNGTCYGVPLYRQGLTSAEQSGRQQSIRMMGGNLWQRSTLTANNGTFYIDTAAGPTKQADSKNTNIFEANRTYYVLFVYATPTTHQTYQLWVGAGLPANWAEQNVFLARVFPGTINYQITDYDRTMWPRGWVRTYDPGTGILTVTIDMGFDEFKTEFAKAQQDFCQPASFCTLGKGGCECNPSSDFVDICKDNDLCAKWAGKDVDWPSGTPPYGGAYAFGLKFPSSFVADDQNHRPMPRCLKSVDPGWNAPLIRAPDELPGACATTPIPPAQFCAG
jgi:hypothetical protein